VPNIVVPPSAKTHQHSSKEKIRRGSNLAAEVSKIEIANPRTKLDCAYLKSRRALELAHAVVQTRPVVQPRPTLMRMPTKNQSSSTMIASLWKHMKPLPCLGSWLWPRLLLKTSICSSRASSVRSVAWEPQGPGQPIPRTSAGLAVRHPVGWQTSRLRWQFCHLKSYFETCYVAHVTQHNMPHKFMWHTN
jgi:hypothetical protein